MTPTIRVQRVQWFDEHPIRSAGTEENAYPGCDGAVYYEITYDDGSTSWMMQPFARGPARTQDWPDGRRYNVWGWDGNREAPSLNPSFLCEEPPRVRVHLFLRAGKIDLCGDSTVRLP